jgi:HK97 family phage major capsid protein
LTRLGVTVLGGLRGNVEIPRQAGGSTAYWVGENAAPPESGLAFDKVALTPHTLAAAVPISRRALLQTSPDIEALTRNDLIRVMALEMDRVGINGEADTDAPDGLLDNAGISIVDFEAAAPTWEKVVDLESVITAADADVAGMSYAMNANMRGRLKTTRKDAGSGLFVMSETGQVNGYGSVMSNQIVAGDLLFGNWSDFVIAMWSGLDLTVDTAANAATGGIVLRAFQDVDFAQRHDKSFARGFDVTPGA